MTRCRREHCGGKVMTVRDDPTCILCGHSPEPKQYPESTDADLRWIENHKRRESRQFPARKIVI